MPLRDEIMDRLARFILRRSTWILTVIGSITALSVVLLTSLEFNSDVVSYLLHESKKAEEYVALREKYRSVDPISVLISLPEDNNFQNLENLTELLNYRDAIVRIDGVGSVVAFIPGKIPGTDLDFTSEVLERMPPAVRSRLFMGLAADILLTPDRRHTLFIVMPESEEIASEAVDGIRSVAPPANAEVSLAGNPVIFATVSRIMTGFILYIPPLVILLSVITFFFVIGNLRLSLVAVLPAILASIWVFALLVSSGIEITLYTIITPLFVLVLGSADGLHFVTHYQKVSHQNLSPSEHLSSALRRVGVPIILTSVTTAAGFLTLLTTGITTTRQLGGSTAVGIVLAGLISLFGLPALLSRIKIQSENEPVGLTGAPLVRVLQTMARRRSVAVALVSIILLTGALSIPHLRVKTESLYYFRKNSEIRSAFKRLDAFFGSATSLVGEFAFEADKPLDPQLNKMASLSRELEDLPGIRRVISMADLSLLLGPSGTRAALDGEDRLGFGRLATEDGVRFLVFAESYTTDDVARWQKFGEEHDLIKSFTGMPMLFDSMHHIVVGAQRRSLSLAFALIGILLILIYRRLRESIVAFIPLVLTAASVLSFLSLSGIHLNYSNAVIGSIVIGVGADYSIHFLAAIDYHRSRGGSYVSRAIDYAGLPIIANAFGIAVGFSALFLSPLRPNVHVAIIMWISMLVAAVTSLVVISSAYPREAVLPARHADSTSSIK